MNGIGAGWLWLFGLAVLIASVIGWGLFCILGTLAWHFAGQIRRRLLERRGWCLCDARPFQGEPHKHARLYVRDITHPNGECPLHGTAEHCPCNDTGLVR